MLLKCLVSNFTFSSMRFSLASTPRLLKIGDLMKQSRTFSDLDILEYSKLSCDSNPLHLDSKFAQNTGFQDRLVHGMLVASLFPRIIASHFLGAVYVSQSFQFELLVYIGDKIVGEVKAVDLREKRKIFIVRFSTKCFRNGELLVVGGQVMAILPTLTMKQEQSIE